ncbi:MAG: DinB family protein [Candidatus Rokubacteria bacterium]|nr:DinB family protein [Candidatus Rokubacteria bacterium]
MARRRSAKSLVAWRRRAIERMGRSRAATLRLLARMPEEVLRRPRTQGEWSIKDVLTHIAGWEEEGTRRLKLIARGRGDRVVWYETMADADRFNARAVRAGRRLGPRALLRRLARARADLVRALSRVPPWALGDPGAGLPVTVWLREFAWTHEGAHRQEIREWGRAQRARRASIGRR